MEGFEVWSVNDDKCIGRVSGREGDFLIVEHGHVRKSRNALPMTFADVDEGSERVITTLAADLVYESPKVNGQVDYDAVAEHYGLADTSVASDELELGDETMTEERAEIRERLGDAEKPVDESPALLGDRYAQVPPSRGDER
jgi:hypothetical protein